MRNLALIAVCLVGWVGVAAGQETALVRAALIVEAPEPPRTALLNAARDHLGRRGILVLSEATTAAGRAKVTAGPPRATTDADIDALRRVLRVQLVVVIAVTPGTPTSAVAITLGRDDGLFKQATEGTPEDLTARTVAEINQLPLDPAPSAPVAVAPTSEAAAPTTLGTGGAGYVMPIYGSLDLEADVGGSLSESGFGLAFGAGAWLNAHVGVGAGANIVWAQPNDFIDLLSWGSGANLFLRLDQHLMGAVSVGYGRVDFILDEAVGTSTHESGLQLGLTAMYKFGGPFGVGGCIYRTSLDGGSATTFGIGLALAN